MNVMEATSGQVSKPAGAPSSKQSSSGCEGFQASLEQIIGTQSGSAANGKVQQYVGSRHEKGNGTDGDQQKQKRNDGNLLTGVTSPFAALDAISLLCPNASTPAAPTGLSSSQTGQIAEVSGASTDIITPSFSVMPGLYSQGMILQKAGTVSQDIPQEVQNGNGAVQREAFTPTGSNAAVRPSGTFTADAQMQQQTSNTLGNMAQAQGERNTVSTQQRDISVRADVTLNPSDGNTLSRQAVPQAQSEPFSAVVRGNYNPVNGIVSANVIQNQAQPDSGKAGQVVGQNPQMGSSEQTGGKAMRNVDLPIPSDPLRQTGISAGTIQAGVALPNTQQELSQAPGAGSQTVPTILSGVLQPQTGIKSTSPTGTLSAQARPAEPVMVTAVAVGTPKQVTGFATQMQNSTAGDGNHHSGGGSDGSQAGAAQKTAVDLSAVQNPAVLTPSNETGRAEKLDTADIARQLSGALQTAADTGRSEIRVHLSPQELGGINVKLVSQGGVLSLQITADNHRTGVLLASNLDDLNRSMDKSGVNMSKTEIFYSSSSDSQTSADSGGQNQRQNWTQARQPAWTPAMDQAKSENITSVTPSGLSYGRSGFSISA